MEIPANLVVIGLHSERPRSGKSTVAAALAELVGAHVLPIAAAIREVTRGLGFHEAADAVGDAKDLPMLELGGLTPREVLILVGEHRASRHGRDYWIRRCIADAVKALPDGGTLVIDDVRRSEEGQALVDAGASVFTIEREGAPDVVDINGWRSDARHTFRNDGSPDECAQRIWGRTLMDRRRA